MINDNISGNAHYRMAAPQF